MEKRQVDECCIKGCSNKHRALGFCNHHYMQWSRYGHPLAMELKYIQHHHRSSKSCTKEYRSWQGMVARCKYPTNGNWANYGGRGISVCERWSKSFSQFLEDMGACPDGMSIDRIDVNGNYEPSNCRWATKIEQGINRRTTVLNANIVSEAKRRKKNGETTVDIAKSFNVSVWPLYAALNGQSWRNVQ